MVRWIDDQPVRWLGEVGQTTPATEGTVRAGFSTSEKILLAGVILSGVSVLMQLVIMLHRYNMEE